MRNAPCLLLSFLWLSSHPTGAEPAPRAQAAERVALLETRAPARDEFLLRATLPVPPGTFPNDHESAPLAILDWDGTRLPTQIETVSRYPDDSEGADVVELIARVHRDPGLPPGTPISYPVVFVARAGHLEGGDGQPPPLDREVLDLLLDRRALEIAAYDCFGNKYVSRPFNDRGSRKSFHRGPVQFEGRVYQVMLPDPPVEGEHGTLPHFLGVHSYVSVFSGVRMVGLDVRFNNGHDGHDPDTLRDDPLDLVYFSRIEISVPVGWTVLQDFEDPFLGQPRVEDGRVVLPLVMPNPAGRMHVMRWMGQFHRRLMLVRTEAGQLEDARAQLNGAGRAFCVRAFDPDDGHEFWSWWNPETARYFPQKQQLPLMDHVGRTELDAEIQQQYDFVVGHLQDGTGVGDYPIQEGVLGWGHPYGVSYGGMTSGQEIFCYDGISTAAAASPRGYKLYSALHRMQTDRMANALFDVAGEPSSVEEWLVENGNLDYVPFAYYTSPLLFGSSPDPFGIRSAPRFQVDYVQSHFLRPAYEGTYLGFAPHDYQHLIRYTRSAKVLAWLGNDSLAKDDLLMQAESFHLGYHDHYNNAFGGAQTSGLRSAMDYVHAFPGRGFPFGRGEAWGIDCAVAAYSLGDPQWRATKFPWLTEIVDVISQGQASCSGFIQAFISDKAVMGHYQARQLIEQSITEHALVGLHETVFRGIHPVRAGLLRDVLVKSLEAFIGEMSWFPGQFGPWRYTGVGPLNSHVPAWCSRAEMPADAFTAGDIETFQDWSSFAYGYQLTLDPLFIKQAWTQAGGHNFDELLMRLRSAGTNNIENRTALLALMQRLDGEL